MKEHKTHRLLRKTSINFLIMSASLFIVTAAALFIYTRLLLDEEIEEELYSQVAYIQQNIEQGNAPSSIKPIVSIEKVLQLRPTILKDTMMFDPRQDELESFRELSKSIKSDEGIFEIKVRTLVIESEDIFAGIVVSFLSILTFVFIILFFINKSRNEKMWKPFFSSLDKLKKFSFDTKDPIVFEASNIQEFNDLNTGLNDLVIKIKSDYDNLKQFTEDVSHEAQTPLAIMQAKIENIINQNNLTNEQYDKLNSIQKDIKRLTHLNKRLILLAKIDNDQFSKPGVIDVNTFIAERVADFEDISENEFQIEVNDRAQLIMDPYLAEILLNNLLSNAVKYSQPKSKIYIKASRMMIQISNTGHAVLNNPDKVFDRFYREDLTQKSTGLGLSIVNKICHYYGTSPSYRFDQKEKLHTFRVDFTK